MKLSRRQFMKTVAAGAVLPSIPALAKEKKYPNFEPTGCCFWGIDRVRKPLWEQRGKIIHRRIKQSIPPAYRDKILVYFRLEDYRMTLRTMILYIPEGDTESYAKKIQWMLKNGWCRWFLFLYEKGEFGKWPDVIFHHVPGGKIVFDDKNYGVILVDTAK